MAFASSNTFSASTFPTGTSSFSFGSHFPASSSLSTTPAFATSGSTFGTTPAFSTAGTTFGTTFGASPVLSRGTTSTFSTSPLASSAFACAPLSLGAASAFPHAGLTASLPTPTALPAGSVSSFAFPADVATSPFTPEQLAAAFAAAPLAAAPLAAAPVDAAPQGGSLPAYMRGGAGRAKHSVGPTLGRVQDTAGLYEYVMEHINDTEHGKRLREVISAKPSSMMMGAPDEAALMAWLCRLIGARKCVEVGAFRGSTTLALAQAMPEDGKVYALDVSEEFVADGRAAWEAAGVADRIELVIAPARDTMSKMCDDGHADTVDLVFIDADKESYDAYYELALRLLRPGGVIVVDNVLWDGRVMLPEGERDAATASIAALNAKIRTDARVDATMLPIADGAYLCRKL